MAIDLSEIEVGRRYEGGRKSEVREITDFDRGWKGYSPTLVTYVVVDRPLRNGETTEEKQEDCARERTVQLDSFLKWARCTVDPERDRKAVEEATAELRAEYKKSVVGTTGFFVSKQDIEPAVSQTRLRRENVVWIGGVDETDDIRAGDAFVDTKGKLWITIKDHYGMLDLMDPVTMECLPAPSDDEAGPAPLRRVHLHVQATASPWKGDL